MSGLVVKKLFYFIIIFLLIGIWLGLNVANNQPLFSNPFVDKEVQQKAAEKVERMGKGAKDAVERTIEKTFGD